jgi:hypothetical protein
MTSYTNHIIKRIFKVSSLDDVSVKQLKETSSQYPFFGVGHYLLTKKLLAQQETDFLDEAKKAALYFSNPYWLQWLLEKSVEIIAPSPEEIKDTSAIPTESNTENVEEEMIAIEKPGENILAKNDELLFVPYHTVDYFASQGIKFIPDEKSADKFGKQLKSFTEWLKTMKKLPKKDTEISLEAAQQAAIDGFAAHSVQQKEILTEAMAEVLAKQGKNEDAVELYKKLSLLNPSKSAYFAAKIEQLNSN